MGWTAYALSLGVGLGVGLLYGFVNVRSPAPPIIALLGLLGMLLGESMVSYLRGHPTVLSTLCHAKSFTTARAERPAETEQKNVT